MKHIRRKVYELIPGKLKFTFSSLWENVKRGRPYYSQNGEDVVVFQFFKKEKPGFYVDIGAHHPKKYSNTHMLHEQGWKGINVDANPKSIKAFNKMRPDDINLNLGVGEKAGELTYYEFADPAVNTLSEIQANHWIKNNKWNKYLGCRKIEVHTVNDVLNKHLPADTDIDLLNVDIESLDEQIIKSLDLKKYDPRVIIIEDHDFHPDNPEQSEIYNYLTQNNYILHCNLSFSLIFRRRSS